MCKSELTGSNRTFQCAPTKTVEIIVFSTSKSMIGKKFEFGWFLSVLRVVRQVQTERDAGFASPRVPETGVFQPAFGRKWQLLVALRGAAELKGELRCIHGGLLNWRFRSRAPGDRSKICGGARLMQGRRY